MATPILIFNRAKISLLLSPKSSRKSKKSGRKSQVRFLHVGRSSQKMSQRRNPGSTMIVSQKPEAIHIVIARDDVAS